MKRRTTEELEQIDLEWVAEEAGHPDTWETRLGNGVPGNKLVAGYPLADLIGNISYTEAIYLHVRGELPDAATARMLDICFTTCLDHGFRNSIAVAARFVASANPDPIAAIAAGLLGIGPNSAGAQRFVVEFIAEGMRRVADGMGLEEAADQLVGEYLAARRTVPGLGTKLHHKVGYDVRSLICHEQAERLGFAQRDPFRFYMSAHAAFERRRAKPAVMNVDGMMGAIFAAMEFSPVEVAALEIVVMLPSVMGHALEEIRQDKRMRNIAQGLVRYTGPARREVPRRRDPLAGR